MYRSSKILQVYPGNHMATGSMRVGDSDAATACLAAQHAALVTHTDVTAKLEEVDTHLALLTAVRLFAKTAPHATMLKSPCVMSCYGDDAPVPEASHVSVWRTWTA